MLITPRGTVIAQLRDNKPTIACPGKVGLFGGGIERGETPLQAALRELHEETNLVRTAGDLIAFTQYVAWQDARCEDQIVHVFLALNVTTEGLEVYEGQGWTEVTSAHDPRLSHVSRPACVKWFEEGRAMHLPLTA